MSTSQFVYVSMSHDSGIKNMQNTSNDKIIAVNKFELLTVCNVLMNVLFVRSLGIDDNNRSNVESPSRSTKLFKMIV